MSTLGIIVEYNPFHNGHLFHVNQAKKITDANTTIAIMSGPFLQRGEPAIIDKWTRAKMALSQGIDLVIELPTIYATQSADLFAFGATSLLDLLKADHLVFGSEKNSINILHQISDLLLEEPFEFKQNIKENLSLGHSYPKALSLSLQKFFHHAEDYEINKPNDILGIQYILNLKKLKSSIQPETISRKYANYHDQHIENDSIASATAIRKKIFQENDLTGIQHVVPMTTYQLLADEFTNKRLNQWENFFKSLLIIATSKEVTQIREIHGMVEGFERRLKGNIQNAKSFNELITLLKTKRYTVTKIQRTLLYLLLDLTKEKVEKLKVNSGPQYIRVLGFNDKGRSHLNQIKHKLDVPLITNIKKEKSSMLALDIKANLIYELGLPFPKYKKLDYNQAPVYYK